MVPSEDYSHWPPAPAARVCERAKKPETKKNIMNTEDINKNTAAPSVTIAPRNPARGVLNFVVTLTTQKDVRAYPCRSMESAIKLAERFIAGLSRQSQATADVTKPAKAKDPEDAANPHHYDGPPRTAEQVAA